MLALMIVVVSLVGVVATAYSFYRPPPSNVQLCGPRSTFSQVYDVNNPIGNPPKYYQAVRANFTNINQNFVFGSPLGTVTFLVVDLTDPSLPHLENGQCINSTDTTSPATIKIQVQFSDGKNEVLTMNFRGGQPIQQVFSSHSQPTAGILWYPNDAHIILVVSKS